MRIPSLRAPWRTLLVAAGLAALPAAASADIILKNKDGRSYEIAVRHSVSTTRTTVPARSYLIVTEGAQTVQLRDGEGNPVGEPLEVADGDRLELSRGKLKKTSSSVSQADGK